MVALFFHLVYLLIFVQRVSVVAQIRIVYPPSLAQQFDSRGKIRGSTAAFGTPYWGEQLVGKLEFANSKGQFHCTPEDYDLDSSDNSDSQQHQQQKQQQQVQNEPRLPDNTSISAADVEMDFYRVLPRIVIVRRGKCHFVDKVRVAQDHKNASAVVIVDDEDSTRTVRDIRAIIMADDGRGISIKIPSVLITNFEGSKLIEALTQQKQQHVVAELFWDMPDEPVVSVDVWMSPGIGSSARFLEAFAPYARLLNNRINWKPHFFLFSLIADANSMCLDAAGRFCSMAPDGAAAQPAAAAALLNATGIDVVGEIERQSCLWTTTKSTGEEPVGASDVIGSSNRDDRAENSTTAVDVDGGEYPNDWWNYVEKINNRCFGRASSAAEAQKPFSKACSYDLMAELQINTTKIDECVAKEGVDHLSRHLSDQAWSPTAIMINGARFSGPLDPLLVVKAICTGFASDEEPPECAAIKSKFLHDKIFMPHSGDGGGVGHSLRGRGGIFWWICGFVGFGLLGFVLCVFVGCYRVSLVKQMRNELRYEVFEEVKSQLGSRRNFQGFIPSPVFCAAAPAVADVAVAGVPCSGGSGCGGSTPLYSSPPPTQYTMGLN